MMTISNSSTSARPLQGYKPAPRKARMTRFSITPAALLALILTGAIAMTLLAVRDDPVPLRVGIPVVAHISGLLAGYGVALMLVLMSRLPALERGVGADRLARWHAFGGRANLVLIAIHAACATVAWTQLTGTSVEIASLRLLSLPG